jgi:hypothetical protein
MVVDMWNVVAHLMMPSTSPPPFHFATHSALETRKRYNLEAHWSAPTRPFAVYRKGSNDKKSEERYQDSLDELCNQYPPPQDDDDDDVDRGGGDDTEEGEGSGGGGIRLTQAHSSGFVFSKPPKDFPK